MFSVMAFMFLAFLGIMLMLFYMARAAERQYRKLREEIVKTGDMLRALEARLPPPAGDAPAKAEADSPLTMTASDAGLQTAAFDAALDLHFDPVTDKG